MLPFRNSLKRIAHGRIRNPSSAARQRKASASLHRAHRRDTLARRCWLALHTRSNGGTAQWRPAGRWAAVVGSPLPPRFLRLRGRCVGAPGRTAGSDIHQESWLPFNAIRRVVEHGYVRIQLMHVPRLGVLPCKGFRSTPHALGRSGHFRSDCNSSRKSRVWRRARVLSYGVVMSSAPMPHGPPWRPWKITSFRVQKDSLRTDLCPKKS